MGVLARAARRDGPPRERSVTGITLESIFGGMFSGDTDADVNVSPAKALGLPAAGLAIRLISRNVGTLPLITYEGSGVDRKRAVGDPTYTLLRRRPNHAMTASVAWMTVLRHLAGWGEAFLGKDRVGDRVVGLWPIKPEQVTVALRDGRKVFRVLTNGGTREYSSDDVIHLMLDSHDGYVGISPIEQHRQAIGYELALQRYGSKTIGGRAIPSGVLSVKGRLPDAGSKKKLRDEWADLYKDSALAHKIAVLDEDAKFDPISVPLIDAQFIDQRRYGVATMAQIFNLPVHKLQGSTGDPLTYNTREGNQLEFLEALRPYMVAIEDPLNGDRELFPSGSDRYCEFLPEALLRVEAKTRAEIHAIETGKAPWKKPSEIRREENLPAEEGFDYVPTQPTSAAGATGDKPTTEEA